MKPQTTSSRTGANRPQTDLPFETWINDQDDFLDDELSSFDTNWIISAGDLFGRMELPIHDEPHYYDEAA